MGSLFQRPLLHLSAVREAVALGRDLTGGNCFPIVTRALVKSAQAKFGGTVLRNARKGVLELLICLIEIRL